MAEEAPLTPVKKALATAFRESEGHLELIQSAFLGLNQLAPRSPALRTFFNSWGQTNNSASALSGYCNRLTALCLDAGQGLEREGIFNAICHLHRVSDEDLGATGATVHADLFYQMASFFCGGDAWLSRRYITAESAAFRQWKEELMLRHSDLSYGLIVTLVHELATHGEVEFIRPVFERWADGHYPETSREAHKNLAWVRVHCGGTEEQHFQHSLLAAEAFCQATGIDLAEYPLESIFSEYLQRKAEAMSSAVSLL